VTYSIVRHYLEEDIDMVQAEPQYEKPACSLAAVAAREKGRGVVSGTSVVPAVPRCRLIYLVAIADERREENIM